MLAIEEGRKLTQLRFDPTAATPGVLWRGELAVSRRERPAMAGDRLVAYDNGRLVCMDLTSGEVLYDRTYEGLDRDPVRHAGIIDGETVLFGTYLGLRGFAIPDGTFVCRHDGDASGTPVVAGPGQYVVADGRGWLTLFTA